MPRGEKVLGLPDTVRDWPVEDSYEGSGSGAAVGNESTARTALGVDNGTEIAPAEPVGKSRDTGKSREIDNGVESGLEKGVAASDGDSALAALLLLNLHDSRIPVGT